MMMITTTMMMMTMMMMIVMIMLMKISANDSYNDSKWYQTYSIILKMYYKSETVMLSLSILKAGLKTTTQTTTVTTTTTTTTTTKNKNKVIPVITKIRKSTSNKGWKTLPNCYFSWTGQFRLFYVLVGMVFRCFLWSEKIRVSWYS